MTHDIPKATPRIEDQTTSSSEARLVWVVCGGRSTEHDVSLTSGRRVASALSAGDYYVRLVEISRSGYWRVAEGLVGPKAPREARKAVVEGEGLGAAEAASCEDALGALRRESPACVFIALHGPGGEDGAIQGLFEWLGVRYTGSGPGPSALAMDKIRSQQFFEKRGMTVPPAVSSVDIPIRDRHDARRHISKLAALANERLSLPVFVKPAAGGSSIGMTLVKRPKDMEPALAEALGSAGEAIVEQRVGGRELTCAVLDMRRKDGAIIPFPLPVTEIWPLKAPYFDYDSKYTPGATDEITPASLDEDITNRVREAALRAHVLIGCRGMSRSDFILRDDGTLFLLEINTIPGMTPTSLLPQGAAAIGLGFEKMCECLIESALEGR